MRGLSTLARTAYHPNMDAGSPDGPRGICPRPGMRVVAVCDLPTASRGHAHVVSGTAGEIVHTPAYFSTSYSIRFDVRGTTITLHRINRREFHLLDDAGREVEPGFPPPDRYPQPAHDEPAVVGAASEDDDAGTA
ncbi:MAG TPA: hypothetical protein VIC62_07910 [Nakamurella sp.]|jgi:hypothetical protein